jgi:hypothetical protein
MNSWKEVARWGVLCGVGERGRMCRGGEGGARGGRGARAGGRDLRVVRVDWRRVWRV